MREQSLKEIGSSTWVLEGPTNIGFIEQEEGIYLVDSGNDKEAGRRINRILKEKSWTLAAIINTHSNADHIGGNDYLQRNLGCRIYTTGMERAFTEHPRLEAAFLWGGMEVRDLDNKFFKARASSVTHLIKAGDKIGEKIETFSLPGHYFDMIGVNTQDGCNFLADALFGSHILEKYKIPFIFDVKQFKKTIETIRNMEGSCFIPSHGQVVEEVGGLADSNLKVVEKIEEDLMSVLSEKKSFDFILKDLCRIYGIILDHGQFALVGSTIRSFLSYLYNEGRIETRFDDNILYWQNC